MSAPSTTILPGHAIQVLKAFLHDVLIPSGRGNREPMTIF